MGIVKKTKRMLKNSFFTEKKKDVKKEKTPPPRVMSPKVGEKHLIISNNVVDTIMSYAYLIGDIEINGVGMVHEEGNTITWDSAWILSDIDDLREEKKERKEKKEKIKLGNNAGYVVKKTLEGTASSHSVKIDQEDLAKLLFEIVETGGDPKDLRLYWHTHGIGSAFWSTMDVKAVENEVKTSNGNEVINVVMVPGDILARIDSGLEDKKAEELTVRMEDENAERYRKLGDVYTSELHLPTGFSAGSVYGWGWPPGEYDRAWASTDRGRNQENARQQYPNSNQYQMYESRIYQCEYCYSLEIEKVDIGGDEHVTICLDCGTCLDGELEGVTLF